MEAKFEATSRANGTFKEPPPEHRRGPLNCEGLIKKKKKKTGPSTDGIGEGQCDGDDGDDGDRQNMARNSSDIDDAPEEDRNHGGGTDGEERSGTGGLSEPAPSTTPARSTAPTVAGQEAVSAPPAPSSNSSPPEIPTPVEARRTQTSYGAAIAKTVRNGLRAIFVTYFGLEDSNRSRFPKKKYGEALFKTHGVQWSLPEGITAEDVWNSQKDADMLRRMEKALEENTINIIPIPK